MNTQQLAEAYDLTETEAQKMLTIVLKCKNYGMTIKQAAKLAYSVILSKRVTQ